MSITARGGYQIVDFKNVILPVNGEGQGTPVTVPGMYDVISNIYSSGKPLLLSNFSVTEEGNLKTIIPKYAYDIELAENGLFVLFFGIYTISIAENDAVTFNVNE